VGNPQSDNCASVVEFTPAQLVATGSTSPAVFLDSNIFRTEHPSTSCGSSKFHPREFVGGFDRPAMACNQGEAYKRSASGHPKRRTPNPQALLCVFSFFNACDVLRIDGEALRARIAGDRLTSGGFHPLGSFSGGNNSFS
jgi:hypothetical protein